MLRLVFLAGALALVVTYYYVFGAGPTASEYIEDLEWWRPWGTALRWLPLAELTQVARGDFPRALGPILLFCAPAIALFAAGLGLFRRNALGRATTFLAAFLMCIFVYYGYRAEQVWRFFEWRFAAVSASFALVTTLVLYAPSLLRELGARSLALAAVVSAAAVAAIFVLSTEVTGTNSEMQFNISPWPIVTLVGFLLVGATIAATHAGSGAAVWLKARLPGAAGIALGVLAAAAIGLVAGVFVFSAPGARIFVAVLAALCALIFMAAAPRDAAQAQQSGLARFTAGALLLIAILGSQQIASRNQRIARDATALEVLVALEAYKKAEGTYPDTLDELVPEYLPELPRPAIGLIRDQDDHFEYSNYGDSYALEFASVLWVQCQYSPPYEFASASPEELAEEEAALAEEEAAAPEAWEQPDVAAPREPTAEDLALQATLAEKGLDGSWSCPEEPPKLW